ncbi:MAG: metal-dependent hydrolase [Granulosicoccus sp.]|nr:metal-dependent hydrolase [Granulosicoccus sp.]
MDTLSQIALGASLAHITLGHQLGNRALLIGAALGTLPDLDVLVQYDDAIESFTYHRSWSHSLWVLSALSCPLAVALRRFIPRPAEDGYSIEAPSLSRWWLATWLILVTHPLLDAFTIYGTQLWWPLPLQPVWIGSVFIIDPLYTLPLLIALVFAWRNGRRLTPHGQSTARFRGTVIPSWIALLVSSAYLGWTLVAQQTIRQRGETVLHQSGITTNKLFISPLPLSLLWRVVAITPDSYYEGFASLLDSDDTINFTEFDSGRADCQGWLDHWPVARLHWFTDGAWAMSQRRGPSQDNLVLTDLRMGLADDYVFEFVIAEGNSGQWQTVPSRLLPADFELRRLPDLWQRVTDQQVSLAPNIAVADAAPIHALCNQPSEVAQLLSPDG